MNPTPPPCDHPSALRAAFRQVYDPEFGVSIEDLGLIYDIVVEGSRAHITMTLTSMYCPAGDVIMDGVRRAAVAVPGITHADVELVWEPGWTPEMLSAAARTQLGWDQPPAGD